MKRMQLNLLAVTILCLLAVMPGAAAGHVISVAVLAWLGLCTVVQLWLL